MFEFCFVLLFVSVNLELTCAQRLWDSASNTGSGSNLLNDIKPNTVEIVQSRTGSTNNNGPNVPYSTGNGQPGNSAGSAGVLPWKNNQVTDPPLGPHDRMNTTDVPEEIEVLPDKTLAERKLILKRLNPTWTNAQINAQIARDDRARAQHAAELANPKPKATGSSHAQQQVGSGANPNVAGWAGGPTTEPALGSNDRINTTDVPEEIEALPDLTRAQRRQLLRRMNPGSTAQQIEEQLIRDDKARAAMAATQTEPVVMLPEPVTPPTIPPPVTPPTIAPVSPPVTQSPAKSAKSNQNGRTQQQNTNNQQNQQNQNQDFEPIVKSKQSKGKMGKTRQKQRQRKQKSQRRPPPTTPESPTPPTTFPPMYHTTEPYFPTTYPTYPTYPPTPRMPSRRQQNQGQQQPWGQGQQNQQQGQQWQPQRRRQNQQQGNQWQPPRQQNQQQGNQWQPQRQQNQQWQAGPQYHQQEQQWNQPRPKPRPRLAGSELDHILSIVG